MHATSYSLNSLSLVQSIRTGLNELKRKPGYQSWRACDYAGRCVGAEFFVVCLYNSGLVNLVPEVWPANRANRHRTESGIKTLFE
jgi:hypothetical protein